MGKIACNYCKISHLRCDDLEHCFQCNKRKQKCIRSKRVAKRNSTSSKRANNIVANDLEFLAMVALIDAYNK